MPLRKGPPARKPNRARIAIGALAMARRTDSSIAIWKQTVTSKRLPKGMLIRRNSPRVDLDDLSMLSRKSKERS
jgi:hypothetical protein